MSNQITQARDSFIENLHSMATGSYLREEDKEFWEAPYPESVVDEARVIIDSLISSAAKVPAANAANTPSVNASADEAEGEDDAPSPQTVAVISAITKEVNALLSLSAAHEDAVLEDEEIRQGIKAYANWPTIPQLYVNGEFVGGSDIMMEMYQAGELQQELAK